MLELWVHFTDGKVLPLSAFNSQSYKLEVDNQTPTILALPLDDYTIRYLCLCHSISTPLGVYVYAISHGTWYPYPALGTMHMSLQ